MRVLSLAPLKAAAAMSFFFIFFIFLVSLTSGVRTNVQFVMSSTLSQSEKERASEPRNQVVRKEEEKLFNINWRRRRRRRHVVVFQIGLYHHFSFFQVLEAKYSSFFSSLSSPLAR